jgi:hypothetical protein
VGGEEDHQRILANFDSFWRLLYENCGLCSSWTQSECRTVKSTEMPFKHFRRALDRTNIIKISAKELVRVVRVV